MFENGIIKCGFGHDRRPVMSGEGISDLKPQPLLDIKPTNPLTTHVRNWLDCARTGEQPTANVDYGYKHGIAVILGDASWSQNRKAYFDAKTREVRTSA